MIRSVTLQWNDTISDAVPLSNCLFHDEKGSPFHRWRLPGGHLERPTGRKVSGRREERGHDGKNNQFIRIRLTIIEKTIRIFILPICLPASICESPGIDETLPSYTIRPGWDPDRVRRRRMISRA